MRIQVGVCYIIRLSYQKWRKSYESLNTFADHAPKTEWLIDFFSNPTAFLKENSLGPMQIQMFMRVSRDAGLINKNKITDLVEKIVRMGWDSTVSLGLLLVILANNNPQIKWYVKNLEVGRFYSRQEIEQELQLLDIKTKDAKSIAKAFKRIVQTPFGLTLNLGMSTARIILLAINDIGSPLVVLYSLQIAGSLW